MIQKEVQRMKKHWYIKENVQAGKISIKDCHSIENILAPFVGFDDEFGYK